MSSNNLLEIALQNNEGVLAKNGAFTAMTGARTGRSPKDRYIVDDAVTHDTVAWGAVNQALSETAFNALWDRVTDYLADKTTYSDHFAVGADPQYQIPVAVRTELAWHLQFCKTLFIEEVTGHNPAWSLMCAANFKTDPARDQVNGDAAVILNFSQRKILVCGTQYAGEMKKAMFSVLNYLLPEKNVLPMHCSANVGKDGDAALFFGLSGTGKTTLSADPDRLLIGDDEHGWGDNGVFNFEGGCYAKCVDLSEKNEPMIWQAIRDGAILENVVLIDGVPDYTDISKTENTRAAYPLTHIKERVEANRGGQPKAVIFLCCDLYGVLPPVAKLSVEQAAYYFLSGYTALVGSTEVGGSAGVKPTFSTCFGAPFFPRSAQVYADLLTYRVQATKAPVYLVNTGWTGGAYGEGGKRFSIPTTRAVITAILNGNITDSNCEQLPYFNFAIPRSLPGVDSLLLDPRKLWVSQADYQHNAEVLVKAFQENFKKYADVAEEIKASGPKLVAEKDRAPAYS